MLDKESAELEAMRSAALKVAREAGGAAVGEDEGLFSSAAAGEPSRQGAEASKPGKQCIFGGTAFPFLADGRTKDTVRLGSMAQTK